MPRQQRYRLPGVPQHVVARGNNRQATFFDNSDYRRYLDCLEMAAEKQCCAIHSYVLMTNHVHLLVTPEQEDGISKLMQSVGRKYVQYVNWTYKRSGTLWEGRYKASPVQTEDYLLKCYRYIELNPVRANMVDGPGEYQWSSYRNNALGMLDPLVVEHDVYKALGCDKKARLEAYLGLFKVHLDEADLRNIRTSASQCRVFGNDRFQQQIENALKIKAKPGVRGRPRKELNEV